MEHIEILLKFGRALRLSGLSVSTTDIQAFVEAVQALNAFNTPRFYWAAAATLLKNELDRPLFNEMFDLWFPEIRPGFALSAGPRAHGTTALPPGPVPSSDTVDTSGTAKTGLGSPAEGILRAALARDISTLAYLAQNAAQKANLDFSFLLDHTDEALERVLAQVGWFAAKSQLPEQATEARQLLEEFKLRLQFEIKRMALKHFDLDKLVTATSALAKHTSLKRKPFSELNEAQAAIVEKQVKALAMKTKIHISKRTKRSNTGKYLDMRRTVIEAAKLRGTPLKLIRRKSTKSLPPLMVLCDVSGSVAAYSNFMLQFSWALQRAGKKVRTFLFIDKLDEVTHFLQCGDYKQAVTEALTQADISVTNNSDYGTVLLSFLEKYEYDLTASTVVVIYGDAKNNGRPAESNALAKIARKARKVIWLNPKPRSTWNTEDSIMALYEPFCACVLECGNLEQLQSIVNAGIF